MDIGSKTITNWASLVHVEAQFDRLRKKAEWAFRGQSKVSLRLTTTLERACRDLGIDRKFIPDIEGKLYGDFRRSYHLFAQHPAPEWDDTLEWLSLMRQYGTPTRLLDFTFSFYIAAYFALEHAQGDAAIWAISKTWLAEQTYRLVSQKIKDGTQLIEKFMKTRGGKAFKEIFMSPKPLKLVESVNPLRLNDRLAVQQGLFLCPGDISSSFSSNLAALKGAKGQVYKIIIKDSGRLDILRKLHHLGINRNLLFPGLEGFAESLRTKMLLFEQMREMEKTGARKGPNIDTAL